MNILYDNLTNFSRLMVKAGIDLGEIRQFPAQLRHAVADRIRTAIIAGALKPQDRIVESQLCKSLKVSRPLLREALRQIEAEGLIDVIPNVGPVVRNPSLDELRHIYDMIGAVSALCARYFAEHATENDIASFGKTVDAVEKALRDGDAAEVRSARRAYYEAFTRGGGSPLIRRYLLQLVALTSHRWGSSLGFPGRPQEAIGEMRRLLEAIRNRDPEVAEEASLTFSRHATMLGLQVAAAEKGEHYSRTISRRAQ